MDISYIVIVAWKRAGNVVGRTEETFGSNEQEGNVLVFELDQLLEERVTHYSCDVSIIPAINDPFVTGVNYTVELTLSANGMLCFSYHYSLFIHNSLLNQILPVLKLSM